MAAEIPQPARQARNRYYRAYHSKVITNNCYLWKFLAVARLAEVRIGLTRLAERCLGQT